jgi:DNA-directed RNA polymerase specialized sigma24 family protein
VEKKKKKSSDNAYQVDRETLHKQLVEQLGVPTEWVSEALTTLDGFVARAMGRDWSEGQLLHKKRLRDDLYQIGILQVTEGLRRYDPLQGASVQTYLRHRLKRTVRDTLRDWDQEISWADGETAAEADVPEDTDTIWEGNHNDDARPSDLNALFNALPTWLVEDGGRAALTSILMRRPRKPTCFDWWRIRVRLGLHIADPIVRRPAQPPFALDGNQVFHQWRTLFNY